mgnify:CR=1 FL=1
MSFIAIPVLTWVIYRTRAGLILRAAGEGPEVLEIYGHSATFVRWVAVLAGGAMAGVGGAQLSTAATLNWSEQMTVGRGYVAVALVIFAGWQPWKLAAGAYLFAGAIADTRDLINTPPGHLHPAALADAAASGKLMQTLMTRDRLMVVVVGDITAEELKPRLDDVFGALPAIGTTLDPDLTLLLDVSPATGTGPPVVADFRLHARTRIVTASQGTKGRLSSRPGRAATPG